jgi:transcriptional regulator with XRE-family HTH domain
MAHSKCPIGVRALERRERRLRVHIGQQVAELRAEAGVSQAALAAAAGIHQGHLSRIERGEVGASLEVLDRIAAGLGAELGVRLFPGAGPRLRDRFQAPMIEALVRRLDPRWVRSPEFPVPRARGFIDLAIGLRGGGMGIECEAQSELRSIDLIVRRQREKSLALQELGTFGTEVSTLLLVRSTQRTRDVARLYAGTLSAAYSARAEDAIRALTTRDHPWPGPALIWVRVEGTRAQLLGRPPHGVEIGR